MSGQQGCRYIFKRGAMTGTSCGKKDTTGGFCFGHRGCIGKCDNCFVNPVVINGICKDCDMNVGD